jgi:nickel transport protein
MESIESLVVKKDLAFLFILVTAIAIACLPVSGFAHKLSVFAWVEDGRVVVQGKLSGAKRPKKGTVYVYDGQDRLILTTEVGADGTAHFPLRDYETGLKIVMDIGEGHQSFWILTPYDIKTQLQEKN